MKKLMIAAAIVCLAVAAQANYINIVNAGAYDGYKIQNVLSGFYGANLDAESLELFNGMLMDASAWSMTKATTWSEHYATLVSIGFASTEVANGVASMEDSGLYTWGSATFALFADGIKPGGDYVLTKTLSDANSASTFDFSNVEVLASGKLMTDSIPEPTSGMLLLLGSALLALRRKQRG